MIQMSRKYNVFICENWDEKKYDAVNVSNSGCDNDQDGNNTKLSMLVDAKTDVLLQTSYFIVSNPEGTKSLKIKVIIIKSSQKHPASVCNFTKRDAPPWVFFMFFKLYKWYQIVQSVSYG